jgi:hypothetical protein
MGPWECVPANRRAGRRGGTAWRAVRQDCEVGIVGRVEDLPGGRGENWPKACRTGGENFAGRRVGKAVRALDGRAELRCGQKWSRATRRGGLRRAWLLGPTTNVEPERRVRNFGEFSGASANFRSGPRSHGLQRMCTFVTAHNHLQRRAFLAIGRFRRTNRYRNGSKGHRHCPQPRPTKFRADAGISAAAALRLARPGRHFLAESDQATLTMSVRAKSSPLNSKGSPVARASA